ncbi:Plug domain-containing protein, partial [Paenibacillus polymyxa]|nr:Plug domain-containing protein [Paenibacillus polymyxa]
EAPAPIAGGLIGGGARMGILGNTSVMDTPFSVTSYTAQTIENEQARSVAAVATMDPSVRMSSARSNINEDLTIRGFNVPTADFAFNGMFGLTPYWRAP